jgi:uncharacterized protein YqgC (DUF456 family)
MNGDPQFWLRVMIESLTLFFIVMGLFGLLVPIFPGLVVIWIAVLAYGLISPGAFDVLGWAMFILITLLMLFGSVIDNILMAKKARDKQAAWTSIGLGILAGIVFSLLLPPVGGILAAPLALFLAEYLRRLGGRANEGAVTKTGGGLRAVLALIRLWLRREKRFKNEQEQARAALIRESAGEALDTVKALFIGWGMAFLVRSRSGW